MRPSFYRATQPMLLCAVIGGQLMFLFARYCLGGDKFTDQGFGLGCVFYGGLIGGFCSIVLRLRGNMEEVLAVTDVVACLLPLGQAIGRFGCYCAGCCYGREWSGIFAVRYIVDGQSTSVFPTWFFESAACIAIFLALMTVRVGAHIGLRTALYCQCYSFARFLIEFMRGDRIRGSLAMLSTSQWISVLVFGFGVYAFCAFKRVRHSNLYFRQWKEVVNHGV